MDYAISMYEAGKKVYPKDCDFGSYSEQGLNLSNYSELDTMLMMQNGFLTHIPHHYYYDFTSE
ncbi:hypothetical protein [Nostoc sp. ChiSLP03a]|uniref:hypothetical protein n=1 Tax=Nostoc sp. ChiSLP03a TaxID=3075380 RepID=UPI002AD1E190|nr:hypothetical protein [Nostoc sp. ChiSLP03a]